MNKEGSNEAFKHRLFPPQLLILFHHTRNKVHFIPHTYTIKHTELASQEVEQSPSLWVCSPTTTPSMKKQPSNRAQVLDVPAAVALLAPARLANANANKRKRLWPLTPEAIANSVRQ